MLEEGEIRFVRAEEADAERIAKMRQRVWATTYRGIYPDEMIDDFDLSWHAEKDRQRIRHRSYAVWLIVRSGEPVGYVICKRGNPVLLMSLYLLEEYRGQGIGRQAMAMVRRFCREQGASGFICHCQPDNQNARAFYEKEGGVMVGAEMDNEESWQNSVIYQFSAL